MKVFVVFHVSHEIHPFSDLLWSLSTSSQPQSSQPTQSATQQPSLPRMPLPFSNHLPYFHSLSPKSGTEHYPQEFKKTVYGLLDNRSKYFLWITSRIQLFFHHFHLLFSPIQSIPPINWQPSLGTIFFFSQPIIFFFSAILQIVPPQSLLSIIYYRNGERTLQEFDFLKIIKYLVIYSTTNIFVDY